MPSIKEVLLFACDVHAGQVDKSDRPYRDHLIRVAGRMETHDEIVVALLHDVLEDTSRLWPDLNVLELTREQRVAICLLTRCSHDTYEEYIRLIMKSALARKVKIADLRDHLAEPSPLTVDQAAKYLEALAVLCEP